MNSFQSFLAAIFFLVALSVCGQQTPDTTNDYKKRVLETTEIDFLSSYYAQDGDNAAVTGGIGTEELTDITGTIVVSVPLTDDDVLTIDAGVSAYTSASSSNVNPFDGSGPADSFVASSGASQADTWVNLKGAYSHSSDNRNDMWSANASVSSEYDYFSLGFGGSYTKLFNEKNTELSLYANIFLDRWKAIYPSELRPFGTGGIGSFRASEIMGNTDYNPNFTEFDNENRNSYAIGLGFSQILHRKIQGSLALDVVQQQGLLSTPFQRVYFSDIEDAFVENFQLADDVERLPDSRFKVALGGRLNWYLNERVSARTFYRYYFDDWGIKSHTASIELPVKLSDTFTIYPSYRFYQQTAADYFYAYETALSTEEFYTSDYDLSEYAANQFGLGASYTDIFTKMHLWKFGLKSIDLKFYRYDRNTRFNSSILTAGFKFVSY
ncbi:DUF3570 domain-containing protein [Aggregatimonas sangjinii]|uniref:DUF3570 domain-containing protein n=1 Tax=Aggregatimonas sangjinii TaxID=2583587 RepID=A0A5B7SWG9_9FLAO|nr:DUF3570 domain-containing protein [Aggregatimonas sangjinii]QCX01679.1 DUF3570 domain-containing protein [Aggregatimonas sangjinii]